MKLESYRCMSEGQMAIKFNFILVWRKSHAYTTRGKIAECELGACPFSPWT